MKPEDAITPADSQDVAAAKFLGFASAGSGCDGAQSFWHYLWHADLRMAVLGKGQTREAAHEDAASKAVAWHMRSAFDAQQALDKAFPAQHQGGTDEA